jgi:tRNA (guanine37-N1)-methyltransferase
MWTSSYFYVILQTMTFHIITLFPESLDSYIQSSIIARAIKEKKIKIRFYNPRDFISAKNKAGYKSVDNKPYGGGPGMVMEALPVLKAVEKAIFKLKSRTYKIIIFAPNGKQFTNVLARDWENRYDHLIMICGRYEGIDARVKKVLRAEEVSVGPFVLTGGELPAMTVLDAVSRQIHGVLGKIESLEEDRVASSEVYTRPEILKYKNKNYKVPKVLLSGNHAEIEKWRQGRQTKH